VNGGIGVELGGRQFSVFDPISVIVTDDLVAFIIDKRRVSVYYVSSHASVIHSLERNGMVRSKMT
jgi:hypothetical protein